MAGGFGWEALYDPTELFAFPFRSDGSILPMKYNMS